MTGSTLSRATLTLLLADYELGAMPAPFEAAYPYTTVAERAAFRERGHGEPRPEVRQLLAVLTRAPAGIVAMGTVAGATLLARGCWHERGAVLARQDADTVVLATLRSEALVDAIDELIPEAKPAAGTSVTVPGGNPVANREFTLFDDFARPGDRRARTVAVPAALATMLSNPIVNCGAFVPFAHGRFLPALTWFDTRDQRGIARYFATSTVDRSGTLRTTYVPGDRARIAQALCQLAPR